MRKFTWIVPLLLWAAFSFWYTSFGGPLTAAEIEAAIADLEAQGRALDPARAAAFRRFLEEDTGDDFVMLNVIELTEPADKANEHLDEYMAHMWPELLSRACHPVMVGTAAAGALDIWGIDGARDWSQGALMRYRSRRDFLAVAANPAIQGPHDAKELAMTKTIAFPLDPWFSLGDPRLVLGLFMLVLAGWLGRRSA
ncbi:MAG: hypothetical protein AAF515_08765 [Pseudomonadota bacterium]